MDEAAVPEMERTAPDLILTLVRTMKPRSAWRGGAADSASAAARGCKVIPLRHRAGGADTP